MNSTKAWQQQLHQDHRDQLVKKIVSSILDIIQQDNRSVSPECLPVITKYAQEIEDDAFNTATDDDDYFQRLAERIYKIQKNHEETRQISRATLSSSHPLSGDPGPSNRTAPKLNINSDSNSTIILSSDDESSDEQDPSKGTAPQSDDTYNLNSTTILPENVDKNITIPTYINRLAIGRDTTNAHAKTNGNHGNVAGVNTKEISFSPHAAMQISLNDEALPTTTNMSVNGRNVTSITTIEAKKRKETDIQSNKQSCPSSIDASIQSLPKHPAVFSPHEIRDKMTIILLKMNDHELGSWFRQPVTEVIAPGYFDIIKFPMDFSTILRKLHENRYMTPFQFCEDVWLVFNNTWTFNKKTQDVYKAGVKLSEMFMELVNPIMNYYGYCCGGQYFFLPAAMLCYGIGDSCCTIPCNGDYFVYNNPDLSRNNLSGDKYTFCKKCFDSVKSKYISVGDEPAKTLVELPKSEFQQAKNDHQEPEVTVDCIVCSRCFHNICVLYHERIWSEGYVCKTCVNQYTIKRKDNRYLAHELTTNNLSDALEKRVNTFLQNECDPDTGRVTIRVLAASDRVCEVKPKFKKHFGTQVPEGYPYRTKAIFAFQEIEGVDVVLFGMHVQEYDSQCPEPNARRVYISYLDSVHYFRPKQKRTALYYEILIGYLEYAKQLGFLYAHIWACPPREGDDYIFHCHPVEQRVPKLTRLQEWYKTMLDIAIVQRVVVDYKNIMKDCTDRHVNEVTDIPYFEGDFWTSKMEDLIEEQTGSSSESKLRDNTTDQKTNRSDLCSKMYAIMKTEKKSFLVVRLRNSPSNPTTIVDTDSLIQCDLMTSRDSFLSFARDRRCDFSSLRRAKYSTMVLLHELLSPTADKISFTCDSCHQQCTIRYHCTVCEDYDLCTKCYPTIKHEHRMEHLDETNEIITEHEDPMECSDEITTNSDTPVNTQQSTTKILFEAIRHAVQCRNAYCLFQNCASYKRLIQHVKECTKEPRLQCLSCKKLLSSIWIHAKTCTDHTCPLPYCATIKHKIQGQHAVIMHSN